MKNSCNKDLSVFRVHYYEKWWNIPAHFRNICSIVRNVYYRAVYGFCPYDTWELYAYISMLMENALTYFKNNCHGHPIDMTEEEWDKYLDEMINRFHYVNLDEDEITQPLYDKWEETCDAHIEAGENPFKSGIKEVIDAWKAWSEASNEFDERKENAIKEALQMLNERYFDLWD